MSTLSVLKPNQFILTIELNPLDEDSTIGVPSEEVAKKLADKPKGYSAMVIGLDNPHGDKVDKAAYKLALAVVRKIPELLNDLI